MLPRPQHHIDGLDLIELGVDFGDRRRTVAEDEPADVEAVLAAELGGCVGPARPVAVRLGCGRWRRPAGGRRRCGSRRVVMLRVSEGTRTPDPKDHNLVL